MEIAIGNQDAIKIPVLQWSSHQRYCKTKGRINKHYCVL